MKSKNSPTPEQSAEFDGYVKKWQANLNLFDWRIQRSDKPAKGAMADVFASTEDRMAVYRLGDSFGIEKINSYLLESTAVHELLHILLAEYRELANAKVEDTILLAAEHRIVNTLERLLVPSQND